MEERLKLKPEGNFPYLEFNPQELEEGLRPEQIESFLNGMIDRTKSDDLQSEWQTEIPLAREEIDLLQLRFAEGVNQAKELARQLEQGVTFPWWDIEEYKKLMQPIQEVTSEGQFVTVLGAYPLNRVAGRGPIMIANHRALFPNNSNCFLDCLTNATVTNLGQGFPLHMVAASSINRLTGGTQCVPYHPGPLMDAAAEALISISPIPKEGAKVAWFNAGGDAVSVAIAAAEKFTTTVHGENGRRKAVYFKEAYHGNIEGRAGRVTSGINQMFHEEDRNSIELEFPNRENEVDLVLKEIKNLIMNDQISCVVMESTQGDGGGVSMNPDFFIELMRLSIDYEIPVIVDEVQSGFGRSGRIFDSEYLLDYWKNSSYVRSEGYPQNPPFILAVAKSMTNGAVPGAAVIFPKEYAILKRAQGLNTYSAHPTTLAATLATVSLMTPELLNMVIHKREIFENVLQPYIGPDRYIKEIRGRGLHFFLYLGENSNQLLQVELLGSERILTGTVARNALRVHPPLNTPDEVLIAIAHAIGETSLRLQRGNISPQTLQILNAGPSGLAVR